MGVPNGAVGVTRSELEAEPSRLMGRLRKVSKSTANAILVNGLHRPDGENGVAIPIILKCNSICP